LTKRTKQNKVKSQLIMSIPLALCFDGTTRLAIECNRDDGPFTCIDCDTELIVRKGEILIHHFAHKAVSDCQGESATHKAAKLYITKYLKQWKFTSTCKCHVETIHQFNDASTALEEQRCKVNNNVYILDVGIYENNKLVSGVEICHTHAVTKLKAENVIQMLSRGLIEVTANDVLTCLEKNIWEVKCTRWSMNEPECITCYRKQFRPCCKCKKWLKEKELKWLNYGVYTCSKCDVRSCYKCRKWMDKSKLKLLEHNLYICSNCDAQMCIKCGKWMDKSLMKMVFYNTYMCSNCELRAESIAPTSAQWVDKYFITTQDVSKFKFIETCHKCNRSKRTHTFTNDYKIEQFAHVHTEPGTTTVINFGIYKNGSLVSGIDKSNSIPNDKWNYIGAGLPQGVFQVKEDLRFVNKFEIECTRWPRQQCKLCGTGWILCKKCNTKRIRHDRVYCRNCSFV
jgi:hypothetical protein